MSDFYSSFITESFRRDIQSGYVTQNDVSKLISENKLTPEQAEVVLELMPALAGMKNLAKSGFQGAKNFGQQVGQRMGNAASQVSNKVGQMGQNIKNTYNQGRDQQVKVNAFNQFKKVWDGYTSTSLKNLYKVFGDNPQIVEAIGAIQQWANYIEQNVNAPQQQQQQQQPVQQQQVQQQQVQQPQQQVRRQRQQRPRRQA